MSRRVILFEFAGRRHNLALQLPFIARILDENPNVSFDIWNLARSPSDNFYLRTIEGERITVYNDFYSRRPWRRMVDIWRHYAHPKYNDSVFVKIDDDVIFVETDRFATFVDAVDADEGETVFSAQVINNGACTPLVPQLWDGFNALDIPLLDVHTHCSYGDMSHNYMFGHWRELIGQPVEIIPTQDWLSINLIGYHWDTGHKITERIGRPHRKDVAGRKFAPGHRIGDEGAANMTPRKIMKGFVAAHLSFGPQQWSEDQLMLYRKGYAEIGQAYLAGATSPSPDVFGQPQAGTGAG